MTKRESEKPTFFASPVVQASVPAIYAWATTVAPAAFGKGGTTLSQFFALLALTFVLLGVMVSQMAGSASKFAFPSLVWGMTLFSSASFLAASPRALATFDTTRGAAGVLGWLLFALASAAPALRRAPDAALSVKPLASAKGQGRSAFGVSLGVALVFCIVLQGYGWTQETAERAVLVRVASIVLSLLLLGLATKLLAVSAGGPEAKGILTPFRTALRILATMFVVGLLVAFFWLRP